MITSIDSRNALSSFIIGASSDFFLEIFDDNSFFDISSSDLSFKFFVFDPSSPGFSSIPLKFLI